VEGDDRYGLNFDKVGLLSGEGGGVLGLHDGAYCSITFPAMAWSQQTSSRSRHLEPSLSLRGLHVPDVDVPLRLFVCLSFGPDHPPLNHGKQFPIDLSGCTAR